MEQAGLLEFGTPSENARGLVGLSLPRLEAAIEERGLDAIHIQAVEMSLAVESAGRSEEVEKAMSRHLEVTLFGMTGEHCEVAAGVYAGGWGEGLASVDCSLVNGQRPFSFEDFLTPVMQVTSGLVFQREKVIERRELRAEEREHFQISLGGTYQSSVVTDANCWSTAYEVLRRSGGAQPTFTLHVPPKSVIQSYMSEDARYSRLLAEQESVAFGDYVIVREAEDKAKALASAEFISHAAVFIDEGVVFERVGNVSALPFRIAPLRDSLLPCQSERLVVEKRRLLRDLPDPKSLDFERRTVELSEGVV